MLRARRAPSRHLWASAPIANLFGPKASSAASPIAGDSPLRQWRETSTYGAGIDVEHMTGPEAIAALM